MRPTVIFDKFACLLMMFCSEKVIERLSIVLFFSSFFLDESRFPWAGAGVGIIVGVIIVISDYLFTKTPSLSVRFFNKLNVFTQIIDLAN